jgi:hypothetical protein
VESPAVVGNLGGEEGEGDDPEDDGENVETQERPVVVDDRPDEGGEKDVAGDYDGGECLGGVC